MHRIAMTGDPTLFQAAHRYQHHQAAGVAAAVIKAPRPGKEGALGEGLKGTGGD
jgi:hypothetical protein